MELLKRCPKCGGVLYSREAPYKEKPLLMKYFAETRRCLKCGEDFNISSLKFRPIR